MKTYYKNNLKQAHLILESEKTEEEDYQLAMLQENQIPGLLKTSLRYVDGVTQYHYDISGKTSFQTLFEKSNLGVGDIRRLSEALLQTIRALQRYMLTESNLLLEPEYIFCEKGNYYFCFYPPDDEELKDKFHRLTEFFVREVNYKDEEGVRLAYMLHKSTMEPNYTIEQILEEFECQEWDDKVVDYAERMESGEMERILIAEKVDMWGPIRKLLEHRKKTCK